ncbi:carbamoyl-phosphate synthase L chain, ATP binding domain-containing protein [Globomyces pollinis-pini]|nr:carbamoyl-phosphate synthase L chain, ATP binding domain-containing protein [Globomyces pollinis-pini]
MVKIIKKLLISNRGEIACRIIKTAKKMGIQTVTIHSTEDTNSCFVRMSDQSILIGSAEPNKSYLNRNKILDIAKSTNCQAIHPGYGFLSENYEFTKQIEDEGLIYIGPTSKSMSYMGDKIQSKIFAAKAGVNYIPGFNGEIISIQHAIEIANSIGYPVMIKASAGGGGKGMRVVQNEKQLIESIKLTKSEASSSFGDNRLLIEKFIESPRHIEIQLIGDQYGNILYLPERECSIQRRNQKVIEETPSPFIDRQLWHEMGKQAVSLAKLVGYSSAGTCEFLVDKHQKFYFLEVNTRLQVEHPITEYVTGIDLVEQMIRVARGEKLNINQSDISCNGWSFESRIYAEHPNTYMPSIGTLTKYIEPNTNLHGIRCDSGVVTGSDISVYYDPLLCKLCTHDTTRIGAIEKMKTGLDSFIIQGVTHNIPLLRDIYENENFIQGNINTDFIPNTYPNGFQGYQLNTKTFNNLVMISGLIQYQKNIWKKTWLNMSNQQLMNPSSELFYVVIDDHDPVPVTIIPEKKQFKVQIEQQLFEISIDLKTNSNVVIAKIQDQKEQIVQLINQPFGFQLQYYGTLFQIKVLTKSQMKFTQHMIPTNPNSINHQIISPMPGIIKSLSVENGQPVVEGQELCIIEAMKMQNVIKSPMNGVIKIFVQLDNRVKADQVLMEFESDSNTSTGI